MIGSNQLTTSHRLRGALDLRNVADAAVKSTGNLCEMTISRSFWTEAPLFTLSNSNAISISSVSPCHSYTIEAIHRSSTRYCHSIPTLVFLTSCPSICSFLFAISLLINAIINPMVIRLPLAKSFSSVPPGTCRNMHGRLPSGSRRQYSTIDE